MRWTAISFGVLLAHGAFAAAIVDQSGAARAGVEIRVSPGKGLGAFTLRRLHLGDKLGEYDGEMLTDREWRVRVKGEGRPRPSDRLWLASRAQRGIPITGNYVLAFGPDRIVDAEDPAEANWCRYINHDSSPNLGLFREPKADGDGFFPCFFVISDSIAPGEELSFDYGPAAGAIIEGV
ncbi:hypothetical protein KFE25_008581 [Diacronema lutheri]|uniref:SET domain-containing protein n=1 Tax=Diacronema lutheri TaxID=2081491 RepID=A0A8J5XYC0_DIALT|nr:hypothetical protein KFE25_008581 [Diacronema lutheri]